MKVTEKAHFVAKKESQMSTHNHTEIANFDSAAEFFRMLG